MTPLDLAEIQHELELMDPEFARALALEDEGLLARLQSGGARLARRLLLLK